MTKDEKEKLTGALIGATIAIVFWVLFFLYCPTANAQTNEYDWQKTDYYVLKDTTVQVERTVLKEEYKKYIGRLTTEYIPCVDNPIDPPDYCFENKIFDEQKQLKKYLYRNTETGELRIK